MNNNTGLVPAWKRVNDQQCVLTSLSGGCTSLVNSHPALKDTSIGSTTVLTQLADEVR